MKEYHSIPKVQEHFLGRSCIIFSKEDGSQIRASWTKKQGWHMYGTRHRLFDKTDPEYAPAIDIFERKYAEPLAKAIVDNKNFRGSNGALAFLEFVGPYSFAGQHSVKSLQELGFKVETNDPKDLVLFDVNINKKGFVSPKEFVKTFGHLHVPEVFYEGILTLDLIQEIRDGKYPVREGVVAKGGSGHDIWMCKIKTNTYLDELRLRFGVGGVEKYGE